MFVLYFCLYCHFYVDSSSWSLSDSEMIHDQQKC